MGTEEAIEPQEQVVVEQADVVEETPNTDGDEAAVEVEATPENDVILDGDEGSQPDKQSGIKKRINKLNAKVEIQANKAADSDNRATIAEEKVKILQMALEQKNETLKVNTPPDPDDFDDGARDPKYAQALQDYQKPFIEAAVQRQTSHLSQQTQDAEIDSKLVKAQTKHYERAEELGIKDFDEIEDKAIAILGKETANSLIGVSDNSHLVLYYLGKNPSKADYFAELIKTNPLKATLELGALAGKLSVKPKGKTEPTPDPDEELQGGSPSAGQSSKHQRLVDKAREAAQNGGSMAAVMEAKKAAKAAGVQVT